jgi:hypothetical protein
MPCRTFKKNNALFFDALNFGFKRRLLNQERVKVGNQNFYQTLKNLENKLRNLVFCALLVFFFLNLSAAAQKNQRRATAANNATRTTKRETAVAVVVDDRLSVLRFEPSLYALPMQRMRIGRTMFIRGEKPADGVKFYRVEATGEKIGWVQTDAVASNAKAGDDARLANLIRSIGNDFDKLELASIFLDNFPKSDLRPAILLIAGDLAEDAAARVTRDAARKLKPAEMQASGAPIHSFYLNFNGLDRYRKVGVNFTFNADSKEFHYDGAWWREIVRKHQTTNEAAEAKKRLESLTAKSQPRKIK